MHRIVLGNTSVSVPPSPGDDWEIPYSSALLLSEFEFELVVHTADDHVFGVSMDDLTGDKAAFRRKVSERARSGALGELLTRPLVVMTPSGTDGLSDVVKRFPDATVLIGGFRTGEFDEAVLRMADARVSLGDELHEVPGVIKRILEGY